MSGATTDKGATHEAINAPDVGIGTGSALTLALLPGPPTVLTPQRIYRRSPVSAPVPTDSSTTGTV